MTWTGDYSGPAVAALRAEGGHVNDEALAHISPARSETVDCFGAISVEIGIEPARLHAPLDRTPNRMQYLFYDTAP